MHTARIIVIAALAVACTTLNPTVRAEELLAQGLAIDPKNPELVELQHLIEQSMKRP